MEWLEQNTRLRIHITHQVYQILLCSIFIKNFVPRVRYEYVEDIELISIPQFHFL